MFDLQRLKTESGLSPQILEQLERIVREDFPDDEMQFELHLMRLLRALKTGRITLAQVLGEPMPA